MGKDLVIKITKSETRMHMPTPMCGGEYEAMRIVSVPSGLTITELSNKVLRIIFGKYHELKGDMIIQTSTCALFSKNKYFGLDGLPTPAESRASFIDSDLVKVGDILKKE